MAQIIRYDNGKIGGTIVIERASVEAYGADRELCIMIGGGCYYW